MSESPATTGAAEGDRPALPGRDRRFRQAAIVYLHVGILYEAAIVAIWRAGLMPGRGPVGLWLLFGALVVGGVSWALWRYRSPWLPRVVWLLHAARLPAVLGGASGLNAASALPVGLWRLALVAVLVNLAFLARAGWDL